VHQQPIETFLHSSNEPSNLVQQLCRSESTINTVMTMTTTTNRGVHGLKLNNLNGPGLAQRLTGRGGLQAKLYWKLIIMRKLCVLH